MNTKNHQRLRQTDQKIQAAYLQLVSENPDKRVKVIDLCALTHINRATFYAHFYAVEDVAKALQTEMMAKLVAILDQKTASDLAVGLVLTSFFELVKENKTFFYHYFIRINAPGDLNVLQNSKINLRVRAVEAHQEDAETFQYHLDFFNGGITAVTKRWLKNDCKTPIPDVVTLITNNIKL